MTRAVPEWIGASSDSPIPDRVKLRVFGRDNGRCKECTRKCGVGGEPPQFDHIKALINGGENRESNLQLLCETCHAIKTKVDVKEKAVVYRTRKNAAGIRKPRTIRKWRKFDGSLVYASRER